MLKPEETARLITRTDVIPNLGTIIRRAREGDPMTDITIRDILEGLTALEVACRDARLQLRGKLGIEGGRSLRRSGQLPAS